MTPLAAIRCRLRPGNGGRGQVLLMFAFLLPVLIGAIAIAMDLTVGYYYSVLCERSAAAGALAGVLKMPQDFAGAQRKAEELVEANYGCSSDRWVSAPNPGGTSVQVEPVPGFPTRLKVTTSRDVPAFFARLFGSSSLKVSRSAVAEYLPPIGLGQPGQQVGSETSRLGTPGSYALHQNSYQTAREQGDPFTPDPRGTSDVHRLSARTGIDTADPSLPDRGGWNYLVQLPRGGQIQVYDAAPTNGPETPCDNLAVSVPGRCNGQNLVLGEAGGDAVRYTIFQVNSVATRSSDVELSQVKIYPVQATPAANGYSYSAGIHGGSYTETYDGAGLPQVLPLNRWWVDIASYFGGSRAQALMEWHRGPLSPGLPPGTYRLRVDTADVVGGGYQNTSNNKRWAVRVRAADGSSCVNFDPSQNCTVNAWEDMDFAPLLGGSTTIPLFELPAEYHGLPVNVYLWDLGDNIGSVVVDILQPGGSVFSSAQGVPVYNYGNQLSNAPNLVQSNGAASVQAGNGRFNGQWISFQVLVPDTYNATSPNDVWSMRYTASNPGGDVLAVVVRAAGSAVRLVSS